MSQHLINTHETRNDICVGYIQRLCDKGTVNCGANSCASLGTFLDACVARIGRLTKQPSLESSFADVALRLLSVESAVTAARNAW